MRHTAVSMRRFVLTVCGLAICAASAGPAWAEHPTIERAEAAAASGNVTPERDLRPLLDALRSTRDVDVKRELISAIVDLGEADASTPNLVKSFLRDASQPVLLEVAKNGNNAFLQGDAIFALRALAVPVATLEEAAAIAEADPDSYVQSRGEILRNYINGLPREDPTATRGAKNPQRAAEAREFLDRRHIAITTQSLRDAAQRADSDAVGALLDAGVAADAASLDTEQTPIYMVVSQACYTQGAETDWLVETMENLLDAGADPKRLDGNKNTLLHHAVNRCGPRITRLLLDAGIDPNQKNGSGVSSLSMALIYENYDAAEVLIERGARLDAEQKQMVSSMPANDRRKALIAKASRPKVEKSPGG